MGRPKITVIGSINMDLVVKTDRVPKMGETVLGSQFLTTPGGKGANQAVACARLGADVTMVGCVGDDVFGRQLVENLRKENISTENVEPVTFLSTGIACITVQDGDNSIIVVPGANYAIDEEKIQQVEHLIKESNLLLLQLEIPLKSVELAVDIAHKYQVPVIVNPAPAAELPSSMLEKITVVTPNEYELETIAGQKFEQPDDFKKAIQSYAGQLVMTKGKEGAYYTAADGGIGYCPGYRVEAVDTTGAGDSFNAGLAVMLAEGKSLSEATKYAAAVGALSVTRLGAQSGMPTRHEVEQFLQEREGREL
ncbi:ribokinase [Aneurinibacillus terranovensis]|uniref:ribokinase n=1 Tax=Aneurinibacillus terranovensis TaxID=278991 RepID=UPI0003F888EB|nr:ribokinase [Aneurinibacillus terranovensis]